MKEIIYQVIPKILLKWYRNKKNNQFIDKTPQEVFSEVYNKNLWESNESISGVGSELKHTESLINQLNQFFLDYNIQSVLDLPCGDFNWMKKVDFSEIKYIGADIVVDLIKNNNNHYSNNNNIEFRVLNLISDPLPKCDLIIVRDCLVHLSYKDIKNSILNLKKSGAKYLLSTSFTEYKQNHDIISGAWRPLNLQLAPFNFPNPLVTINENYIDVNGRYKDKSMLLWNLNEL